MHRLTHRALVGSGLGLGLSLLMVVPLFLAIELSNSGQVAFETINAPAFWLAHVWTHDASLPPRGEIAWVIVPAAMLILQWSMVGLLAGLCSGLKLRRNGGSDEKQAA